MHRFAVRIRCHGRWVATIGIVIVGDRQRELFQTSFVIRAACRNSGVLNAIEQKAAPKYQSC